MNGLPFMCSPSAEIFVIYQLVIPIREIDGKYKDELETYLRRANLVRGGIFVKVNETTGRIGEITYFPIEKRGKTKPAMIEARNIIGNAVNRWYASKEEVLSIPE